MRYFTSFILALFVSSAPYAADFSLKSSSFPDNGKIPPLYGCDGKNISPQLSWSNAPSNTQSFALILTSPDWTTGKVYLWVLYNIPATMTSLKEKANRNLPYGIKQGNTYYYDTEYHGPCPPDHLNHHYVFTLYALDTTLDLLGTPEIDDVLNKMEGHILGQATLTGLFSH